LTHIEKPADFQKLISFAAFEVLMTALSKDG
jgi:hypothetical protein